MRHVLYGAFCLDEEDRLVMDGVLALIAGPIRTESNWRFGQPSFIGADSPGFEFGIVGMRGLSAKAPLLACLTQRNRGAVCFYCLVVQAFFPGSYPHAHSLAARFRAGSGDDRGHELR